MTMGLVNAARQIESYGMGPDRQLAHISPDEARLMDTLQGGRRINPMTGLPQYGTFGKILKAVARVAATTVGYMYGGPLGAAAASAAATKLTGGSWKQALTSGAIAGVTVGIGNYASGVRGLGNIATTTGNSLVGNAAAANFALGGVNAATPAAAATAAQGLGGEAVGLSQALSNAGTLASQIPGTAASMVASSALPAFQPSAAKSNIGDKEPDFYNQAQKPYGKTLLQVGDDLYKEGISHYGGRSLTRSPEQAAQTGVMGIGENPFEQNFNFAEGGQVELGSIDPQMLNAARWGYVNARKGGIIHGPGTGTSDDIPAMLSDGEHVLDARTVDDAGGLVGKPGNNDAGQAVIEKIKQKIRKAAGRKNPKSPTSPIRRKHRLGLGSMMRTA